LDNAFDYLEKAVLFLANGEHDIWSWKWVSISLHGALYGFAVCMAKGDQQELKKPSQKNWLDNFDLVFELCQNGKWINQFPGARKLVLTDQQKKSVELLQQLLRNGFEHFRPFSPDVKTDGLPEICSDYFALIKGIITESNTFSARWEEKQLQRAICLCDIGLRLAGTSRFSLDKSS
jgi:hypothetical protein